MTTDLSQTGEVLIYQAPDGSTAVEVVLKQDTLWLSLQKIADLFGRDKSVISRHLKNIYETNELDKEATVAKNATVQVEGARKVRRDVEFYSLDAILSVGYRVNSNHSRMKDVCLTAWCIDKNNHWMIAATIVHEFAHVAGAPGGASHAAEKAADMCGFKPQYNPHIFGSLKNLGNYLQQLAA